MTTDKQASKLAYDLALLCVQNGLQQLQPDNCVDAAEFALKTFTKSYRAIIESGEPSLDFFSK